MDECSPIIYYLFDLHVISKFINKVDKQIWIRYINYSKVFVWRAIKMKINTLIIHI